jgi:hypothetical protein
MSDLVSEGMLLFVVGVGITTGSVANLIAGTVISPLLFTIALFVWVVWFTKWAVTGGLPPRAHR